MSNFEYKNELKKSIHRKKKLTELNAQNHKNIRNTRLISLSSVVTSFTLFIISAITAQPILTLLALTPLSLNFVTFPLLIKYLDKDEKINNLMKIEDIIIDECRTNLVFDEKSSLNDMMYDDYKPYNMNVNARSSNYSNTKNRY